MDDPSAPDPHSPERSGPRVPIDRAVILLGLFVVATVLLLGQIHTPAPAPSGSVASPTTTTPGSPTTTTPGSPTTTAPVARITTTTTSPAATAKSHVPVLVANASGKPGAAATITNELQVAGWTVQAPINATANVATSTVYYVAGQKVAATAVAATLHLTPSAVLPYTTAAPVSTIGTAEVLVVVAPDLAGAATSTTTASGN